MNRKDLILITICILLFSGAALLTGTPGADWNTTQIYNVTTELAHSLRYTLSRTPGQPFLDYLNFITWSFAGGFGVHAWFIIVSALGILALFRLVRLNGGCSPLAAALTLALNPLFLANAGGVGDFAASASFLLISFCAGAYGFPLLAGLCLGLAAGCRLVFYLYVIPLAVLVAFSAGPGEESRSERFHRAFVTASTATVTCAFFYAPLFAFFGKGLLINLPFQTFEYHASAFTYKLFISLGLAVWLVVAALIVRFLRNRRQLPGAFNKGLAICALLLAACCALIFFRVPTKPALTLPILIAIILLVQTFAGRAWAYALLAGSVLSGIFILSPYDRVRDRYVWHIEPGWYQEEIAEANQNRFQLRDIHATLAGLPTRSLLVTTNTWTAEEAAKFPLDQVQHVGPVNGLTAAVAFSDLGADRVSVDIHEPKLLELLQYASSGDPGNRIPIYYESQFLGLLRRWSGLNLERFGTAVNFTGAPLAKAIAGLRSSQAAPQSRLSQFPLPRPNP
jgi:hypothetical protein